MRRGLLALWAVGLTAGCGDGTSLPGELDPETLGQPLTVCDGGATLQGADLSSYQGAVNWAQVAGTGLTFSIAKATEGLTLQDSEFGANWTGMKQNGIVRGAYHYFHSLDDGTAQADAFLAEVSGAGGLEAGDLPPFLDWEDTDPGDTSAHAILEAQAFLTEIQAQTGLTPIIYSSTRIFTALGFPSQFGIYPFWVASRGVTCPDVPSPWTGWLFWQYSFTGTIAGMNCPGTCDMDEYNGDLSQLQQVVIGADGGADAGSEGDAGEPEDAGSHDAGRPTPDAGMDAGTGPAPDAGTPDAGPDAGVVPDAGLQCIDYCGDQPFNTPKQGCGCSSGDAATSLLWLFGALPLLRRRRR
jgi:lysozyme